MIFPDVGIERAEAAETAPIKPLFIDYKASISKKTLASLDALAARAIDKPGTKLIIGIDSNGGDPDAALATFSYLRHLGIPITTYAMGTVYSAATILFLAGDRRIVSKTARILFHPPTFGLNYDDVTTAQLRDGLSYVDSIVERMAEVYVDRVGIHRDEADNWLTRQCLFNPDDAVRRHIATEVGDLDIGDTDIWIVRDSDTG